MLGLIEFEVVAVKLDDDEKIVRLTVVPVVLVGCCPHCGGVCQDVHQSRDIEEVYDLPIAARAVRLRGRVSQLWCCDCQRAFTPPLPGLAVGTHATARFLAGATELIRHGGLVRVAAVLRVPEKSLSRWYYQWVEQGQPATPAQPITRIGINELSQKEHRQFVAVIVGHTNRRVLEVLESRDKATVVENLRSARERCVNCSKTKRSPLRRPDKLAC